MTVATVGFEGEVGDAKPNQTEQALSAVQSIYDEYVVFPSDEARDAAVLWVLHTYVFRAFDSTPRLSVRSAEPASGKSRVLELLEQLTPNPMNAVYLTPGVMWRSMESTSPTILLDEADTIFGRNGSSSAHRYLRGIVNAGHRAGATVPRCVGAEDVKQFHVFGPVALAGLGRLPDTIATRSIEIVMRRRRKGDREIRPFRLKFAGAALRKVRETVEQWASKSTFKQLATSMPQLPVKDRAADVWEPLVAIADLANPEWGERARKACKALTEDSTKRPESVGVKLLADLREVFGQEPSMLTRDLLVALTGRPDGFWADADLDAHKLARLLSEYGVRPVVMRCGEETPRGYRRASLEDAWARYVPEADES